MSSRETCAVLVLGAFSLAGTYGSAGDVVGRVSVLGKGHKPTTQRGATLAYLEGIQAPVSPADVTIKMEGKTFMPRVVAVPVGSRIHFPNLDPIHHNAFSVSHGNRFDLELYKRPGSRSTRVTEPGVVRVYCNIHPQMTAIVLVRDNPYYAWVGEDGAYRIKDVPPGRYEVVIWNERAREMRATVVVPAEGSVRADVTVDASRYRRVRHKNKYGRDYKPSKEKY